MLERRRLLQATIAAGGGVLLLPAGWMPRAVAAGKWTIGFSQATTLEPWRVEFNKKLEAEAAKHTDQATLLMADGEDQTTKQVADMDAYIRRQVDLILCSPKESAGLTSAVEQAMDAKIPVILLDRNVNSDNYTQFIGGDNIAIGKAAGTFAVSALGGPGNAHGNIVEIWGGLGTAGSHDRSSGFHSVTDREPGLKYLLNQQSADWKQDKAYEIMSTALRNFETIDLVFAHNDPMAYGGYLAAKDANRTAQIKFTGADGLPDEGVKWVYQGILAATFLYPTPGAEGFRQGLKLLGGQSIPKKIVLATAEYTKANAGEVLKANGLM